MTSGVRKAALLLAVHSLLNEVKLETSTASSGPSCLGSSSTDNAVEIDF